MKNDEPAEIIFDVSNDQAGKLVNFHQLLKDEKKWAHTVVILLVSNDQAGRLVIAQALLKL